jgi:hypothetical protein
MTFARHRASMKWMLVRFNKRETTPQDHPGRLAERLLRAGHRFLAEDAFASALRVERKRAERSGTPVLLVLLSIEETVSSRERQALLLEAALCLFPAVREADIKGWYRRDVAIGVIFTEINQMSAQVQDKILAKIRGTLYRHNGDNPADRVDVSVHVFTDWMEKSGAQSRGSFDLKSYPDLPPRP